MDWTVDPASDRTPSQQIVDCALQHLVCGELSLGDALPPVRKTAAMARVSHNTVMRAWRELEELGIVEARGGSGVYVTAQGPEIAIARVLSSTLDAFERAALDALRVGHPPNALARRLEELRGRSV